MTACCSGASRFGRQHGMQQSSQASSTDAGGSSGSLAARGRAASPIRAFAAGCTLGWAEALLSCKCKRSGCGPNRAPEPGPPALPDAVRPVAGMASVDILWGNSDACEGVLAFLDSESLCALGATSSRWAAACASPAVWSRELVRQFGPSAGPTGVDAGLHPRLLVSKSTRIFPLPCLAVRRLSRRVPSPACGRNVWFRSRPVSFRSSRGA